MDRDVPSVPITTLAGVTDLLPEMPLPTPLPQTLSNKSLLFHPRVAEEAQNLLGVTDEVLVPQLVHSLIQTSADHIEVKDSYAGTETFVEQQNDMPELLKAMIDTNPNVFNGSSYNRCNQNSSVTNELQSNTNNGLNTQPVQQPSTVPSQSKSDNVQESNDSEQLNQISDTVDSRNTRSKSKGKSISDRVTLEEASSDKEMSQTNVDILNKSDTESTSDCPQSVNNAPTIMQPVVRLQRISSEDQILIQKSLADFVSSRPNKAKELGIAADSANNSLRRDNAGIMNSDSDSDMICVPTKQSRGRRVTDDEFTGNSLRRDNTSIINTDSESELLNSKQNKGKRGTNIDSANNRLKRDSSGVINTDSESDILNVSTRQSKLKKDEDSTNNRLKREKINIISLDSDSEAESVSSKHKTKKVADEDDEDFIPDKFESLVGNRKRRKEEKAEPVIVKPKLRRVEKKFVPVLEKLSINEITEINTYQQFNRTLDYVMNTAEEIELTELPEDGMVPEELLLNRHTLQELLNGAAKLKSLGATEMISIDRLVRLLNILEINVRGGDRISPISDEDNENIRQLWMETSMERIMGAADASLTCLYIMTSSNMPKRVYIEDVIDRIVLFVKYQMHNTIFPSYDSTYRLDNKKKDGRRKKSTHISEKSILLFYNKICELINLLAELLRIQVLTDTSVLHASSMGVSPFFTENVSELQLASLRLVTTIFTRYEKHRRLLLDDILSSIARLPSTKRSLRSYRLNSEEHIQMLTALVLQLIQCVVSLPSKATGKGKQNEKMNNVDDDVMICNKYEKATSTAGTFLTVFLSKCGSKTEDIDYRPLFENFVQDLLTTVNKPEWPATELLLGLLGRMLVKNFSNKSTDMSLRVASLDYLGVVAARLRRDSVLSRCKLNTIDQMIREIKSEEMKENEEEMLGSKKIQKEMTDEERTQFLQRVLLDYLAVHVQKDEAHRYARQFYIAQWYKEACSEKASISEKNRNTKDRENHRSRRIEKHNDNSEVSDSEEKDKEKSSEQENAEKYRVLEERKKFLASKINPFQEAITAGNRVQVCQTYIDYNSAELIAQYLASKRSFSQSFDIYLKAILIVLKETSIAIRTKALKCLTMIVEADPAVLGRHDMQMGVNVSFLDHSTSVREAAVDLVGKFVLSRPELINKYYEMLSARILDTGVSVRKRVIKILKDICIECPEFPKIPEICVKMIRRVNDEDGIRKLVMEVFQNMWFTPTKDSSLLRKVMNITDVVASSKDIGLEWFEQLLISLFKPKEDKDDSTKLQVEPPKALLLSCKQIVDCLIENVLSLEETTDSSGSSQRLVACLTTLCLFAKIRPQLLINHAITLQPYLSLKCQTSGDIQIISSVAKILELVVPLMEHPSESFLAQLEEDSMKLILQHDRPIVSSCLSCLGSVVNNVTKNFKLIRDCFKKYYGYIRNYKSLIHDEKRNANDIKVRMYFRRALFIVGLILRHFDFKDPHVIGDLPSDITDQVYRMLCFYLQQDDSDIQANTLKAIGSICIRHYEFMLEDELKLFYHRMLMSNECHLKMKSEVLINIEMYLIEEEKRMIQENLEWSKNAKKENLKEMGDISSGMASTVIQLYLKQILQSYMHSDLTVRKPALKVVQLILQQGLVHPVQIIPYLICMSTDTEKVVSHSADKQLLEIEKKYPGFIHTKSSLGVRLSYELQRILQTSEIVRGFRVAEKGEYPSALNGYLYSILRSVRQQRRALLLNILKQFDDQARTSLSYMLYLADNLAYFPYMVQDEPLFIVHHIDIMISVSGTNLLQSFREGLLMTDVQQAAIVASGSHLEGHETAVVSALDEEDEDENALADRVPEDVTHLQACITAAQGCLLLLVLKQHLKTIYGLSDSKIQQYSPSEPAKVYEKASNRRSSAHFNPKVTISKIKEGSPPVTLDSEGRKDLIRQYLDFKQLMLKLDPDDQDDEENKVLTALGSTSSNPVAPNTVLSSMVNASMLSEADKIALSNYKENPTLPKVPKLVIPNRRLDSDSRRMRNQKSEKTKKHKLKKKKKKYISSSTEESDYSDPDFMA